MTSFGSEQQVQVQLCVSLCVCVFACAVDRFIAIFNMYTSSSHDKKRNGRKDRFSG